MRCYFSESLSSYFTYVNTCKFTSIFRSKLKCGDLIVQRAEKFRLMSKTVVNFTTNGLKGGGSKFFFSSHNLLWMLSAHSGDALWSVLHLVIAVAWNQGVDPFCLTSLTARVRRDGPGVNSVNLGCGPHLDHPPAPCSEVWCVCGQ